MNVFEVNLLSLRLSSSDDPRELGLDKLSAAKWISFRDWKKGLGCCGVNSYRDWNKNQYYNCSSEGRYNPSPLACSVPHSCCKVQDTLMAGVPNILCGNGVLKMGGDSSLVYTIGCIDAALGLVETQLPIVGGIAIGICFVLKIFTVPIRPNLTESKPKLNPGFTFRVYSGFTRVDPE
uniref:Tetraspanin-33 n=1 Tax=Magallana gigas TaxID=29159 RepID=K1PRQ8_MAGGI